MKQQTKIRRAFTLFTLAALLVVLMSNVFMARSQTNELPDTVWTKFTYPYAINAVKFTPDGRYLASGGDDGVPRLWDAETGELVREFQGNTGKINSIDINKMTNQLAAVNDQSDIKIWDIKSGNLIKIIEKPNNARTSTATGIIFSNNGQYLVAGLAVMNGSSPDHSIFIWSTKSWELLKQITGLRNSSNIKFSNDDKILANPNLIDQVNYIYSVQIFSVPYLNYLGLIDYRGGSVVSNIAFSSDNQYLAGALTPVISSEPNKIWNTSDWSLFKEFGEQWSDTKTIQFSKDNNFIVYGPLVNLKQGAFVRILDYNNLTIKYTYKLNYYMGFFGHDNGDWAYCIDINDNNDRIAVGTGAGLYLLNAKWNPTSVAEGSIQILEPEIFPNPNDGKAIIRFNLIKNADVSVDIYDINSRLISNLYKGELNQGIQSFEWLAKVPNGIYFAKISSGKSVSSIKIIVER